MRRQFSMRGHTSLSRLRSLRTGTGFRAEAMHVTSTLDAVPRFQDLMPQQSDIAAADQRDWRMLLLKAYGAGFQANAARCPLLWSLIADSPLIVSASLSFLSPRKHIPRHRGPFRGILRFYMGLSVPTDDSGGPGTVLQIDGVDYRLNDGEALLWDDTYPHEVWNTQMRSGWRSYSMCVEPTCRQL